MQGQKTNSERRAKIIALLRDPELTHRAIATRMGVSAALINQINRIEQIRPPNPRFQSTKRIHQAIRARQ